MQFRQAIGHQQIPLFGTLFGSPSAKPERPHATHERPTQLPGVSELCVSGEHSLGLLASVLRDLSQCAGGRWLTLVAPPSTLTQHWLRDAGLNRECILLLQPKPGQRTIELVEHALRLGRSHTVISWLQPLDAGFRQRLANAANVGRAQSLNISLR